MSTKFRNSEEIRKAFQDLFAFKSNEEEIEHNARMIMYRFLSEVEILTDEKKMTRKELAQKIGTSASFLTQLYRGSKLLNLTIIAKFEKALGVTFNIKAIAESESINQESSKPLSQPEGFWYFKKFNTTLPESVPPCSEEDIEDVTSKKYAA